MAPVGANGQGLRLKLALNISLVAQMLAFGEGVLLAERGGIEREVAVEVMAESAIGSPFLRGHAPLVLDLTDEAWFDVELAHKDIRLALQTAQREGPLSSAALGYGHRDIASLFAVLAQPAATSPERAELSVSGGKGRDAVSMDAVAERAGISKATTYRWWPTKETLALDALYHEWAAVHSPGRRARCAQTCCHSCAPGAA